MKEENDKSNKKIGIENNTTKDCGKDVTSAERTAKPLPREVVLESKKELNAPF